MAGRVVDVPGSDIEEEEEAAAEQAPKDDSSKETEAPQGYR